MTKSYSAKCALNSNWKFPMYKINSFFVSSPLVIKKKKQKKYLYMFHKSVKIEIFWKLTLFSQTRCNSGFEQKGAERLIYLCTVWWNVLYPSLMFIFMHVQKSCWFQTRKIAMGFSFLISKFKFTAEDEKWHFNANTQQNMGKKL